jgi:formamidopyrimidine-DNA glycosylase
MEGPQTRALADHLNEIVTGKPVLRIVVPEHRWQANVLLLNCVGQVIQRVRSHGKWLFFDFSHGVTWLCQLITRAKWTIFSEKDAQKFAGPEEGDQGHSVKGGAVRRGRALITVFFRNGNGEPLAAVLTGRPIFAILPSEKVWSHPEVKAMGPDPLATATFHDDFPYRLRQHPTRTVAAALLDQEIVAGLGNMLKCEILFATRFSPGVKIGTLVASQIDFLAGTVVGIVATASTFASKNQPFPYRVYDRAGMPCPICGTEITVDRSGQDGHLTWYCPGCQPVGREPTLFGA